MKSLSEIQEMLISELRKTTQNVSKQQVTAKYYNDLLGNTSILLAALLDTHLQMRDDGAWPAGRWIDDSLLTGLAWENDVLTIDGIMIWGVGNDTNQWTDPFSISIEFDANRVDVKRYHFLFGDLHKPGLQYEDFNKNRDYWSQGVRDWKFLIDSAITTQG